MSEWKVLDKYNIPSNILVADYEFRARNDFGHWDIVSYTPVQVLKYLMDDWSYQYRKKEPEPVMPFGKFWDSEKEDCVYGYLKNVAMFHDYEDFPYIKDNGSRWKNFEAGLPEAFKEKHELF